jgi:hypothetical protein
MTGLLTHIDGRKLTINYNDAQELGETHDAVVYLRKGVDSAQYMPLLLSEVEVTIEIEKGHSMVKEIRPALPKTEAESVKGPVDMAPSANVPVLNFGKSQESFTTAPVAEGAKFVQKPDNRTQKDKIITASWAMGNTLLSPALANCNDAMALNTQQTLERAKRIALELTKWVEEQSIK